MRLLLVIVNYRTADLTLQAAEAALSQLRELDPGGGSMQMCIVDNDSGDDSADILETAVAERDWGSHVRVHRSERNGGFAYGNNQAIRPALAGDDPPDFVYLLNPDAVPDPGCVGTLLDFMQDHPDAGIVGSRVHGGDGEARPTAFRFPTLASELEDGVRTGLVTRLLSRWMVSPPPPGEPTAVDWLSGASLMIRREVFESVGLFDEGYFLYFEETDLCHRAHRAGWNNYYVPEAGVMHIGSVATGLGARRTRRPAYWFDSRARYFRKNYGDAYLHAANAVWATGLGAWQLRRRVQGLEDHQPEHVLGDLIRHSLGREPSP